MSLCIANNRIFSHYLRSIRDLQGHVCQYSQNVSLVNILPL